MSSIRPLATITILIGVGVVLWMKINETEPVLPEGLDSWQVGSGLEFGAGADASLSGSSSDGQLAPQFSGTEAPAFDATSSAPAFGATPSAALGDAAPAWEPPPTSDTGPQITNSPSSEGAAMPALPPMPSVPELDAATDSSANPAYRSEKPEEPAYPSEEPEEQLAMTVTPRIIEQEEEEEQLGVLETTGESSSGPVTTVTPTPQTSLFAATRVAVQSALDRGELSRALLLLSDWYGDPSLSADEKQEVNTLLAQLAGTVIYSKEPRLEPPYRVQSGETLAEIAVKYNVPAELLAKVNGIARLDALQPGAQLKVLRGPFSAVIDVSQREMTLMLDRRYAGRFPVAIDPNCTVENGQWMVEQKPLTPAGGYGAVAGVERSLVLTNPAGAGGQVAVIRGSTSASDAASVPRDRAIQIQGGGINDVFDILSIGSRVVIRR